MNWEGHDDWLADTPVALELRRQFDGVARPPPSLPLQEDCQPPSSVGVVPANPYEQVRPICEAGAKPVGGDR